MSTFRFTRSTVLLLSCLALPMAGCSDLFPWLSRPLRIESAQNPNQVLQPNFPEGFYRADRDKNLWVILENKLSEGSITQTAIMRIFWQPVPGKTALAPTALNATFRYIVMTPTGVGMYEGAGFVRLRNEGDSPVLHGKILDADLRLTQATAGFTDALGRSRLVGAFEAALSDSETLDRTLSTQRAFFQRSYQAARHPELQPAP